MAIRLNQTAIQAVTPITSFEKRPEGSPNPDRSGMLLLVQYDLHPEDGGNPFSYCGKTKLHSPFWFVCRTCFAFGLCSSLHISFLWVQTDNSSRTEGEIELQAMITEEDNYWTEKAFGFFSPLYPTACSKWSLDCSLKGFFKQGLHISILASEH